MSDFHNNPDKQDFVNKLEVLRDLESEKPVEEIDVSLVKACVELILEYSGETVKFTPEEIDEKVKNIPFVEETTTLNTPPKSVKGRSTKAKSRKLLLIAAIISILIAIFAVTSIAFDWNIFDELKERFGTVANSPVDEKMEIGGVTVVSHGKTVRYGNLETALKSECIDILYPTQYPEDTGLDRLLFYQEEQHDKIALIFDTETFSYFVTLNQILSEEKKIIANEILTINGIDCYLIDISDIGVIQAHFEYDGNLYMISYTDKETLIEIIENLKESK